LLGTVAGLLTAVTMSGCGLRAAPPDEVLTLAVPGRSGANPWVAAQGSFTAVAFTASSDGKADVFVAISRDAGASFGTPVQVNREPGEVRPGGELPPRVALVPMGGSAEPEIVVLWNERGATTTIKTSRSRDGGKTFDAPVALQSPNAPGDRGWQALALDRQGTAHAIWLDHRGLAAGTATRTARPAKPDHSAHDGVAMAQKSSLYYASVAGSSGSEREVARGVCYCCKTALAIAPDGALYAAWRHVYPGNLRDMALTVSRDGGKSFSAAARVSEDGWAINGCPDDGPAMAVDGEGTVHLVWPTVIGESSPEGALFYASTRDGRTFTPRTRIPALGSPKPSHPQILVDSLRRVVVAWDEFVDGRRVAAIRELKVRSGRPVEFGSIVRLSSEEPSMYPVLAATKGGMLAAWTAGSADASAIRLQTLRLP
jgi:hypothetical protein